jgi:putative ABC transport system permease protein
VKTISPDYFRAIGVPVLAGRAYVDADSETPGTLVILNEIAAKRFLEGANPIGAELSVNGKRTVVGVVKAIRIGGPEAKMRPEVYLPFNRKRAFGGNLIVRTSHDPASLIRDVRGAIHAVLPDQVVPEAQTLDTMYEKLIVQRKFNMLVLALFGALALVIAGVGIYGVMAYIVEQRTQEIGVRMALGAQPVEMLRMVLSRAGVLMGLGLAIGLGGGWMLSKLVATFLFQIDAHDPIVFVVAAGALLMAGFIAAFVPARRASKVDPLVALRA